MNRGEFRARGSGPGPQTRDGCSVEVYKRSSYNGELDPFRSILKGSLSVLELGCGTGRLTRALVDWGLNVTAVDNSIEMLGELPEGVRRFHSNIEDLKLCETFDVVMLASFIINTPDTSLRTEIIASAKRHLAEDGVFLIECQDPDVLRDARSGRQSTLDGITTTIESVTKAGSVVRLTISYRVGQRVWFHEFDAAALESSDVAGDLELNGMKLDRWIDDGTIWAVARHE